MKSFRAQPLYFPILIAVLVFRAINCLADTDAMEQATQFELSGKFKEAATSFTKALDSKSLTKSERKKIEFELDRLERIKRIIPTLPKSFSMNSRARSKISPGKNSSIGLKRPL